MVRAPETQFVQRADGLHIAYQVSGEGPREVVFVPTAHCADLMWDEPRAAHFLDRLANIGRLVLVDFWGFGASDPVPLGALPTPEAWMEDLRVVLDAVGSAKANIVSHGGSGFLGMLFAATYPERTETLTLVETTARLERSDDYPIGVPRPDLDAFVAEDKRLWGTVEHARLWAPSHQDDGQFCRWLARMERGASSKASQEARFRWLIDLDMRAVLPSIRVPTLVVNRERDFMNPQRNARFLQEHIEGSRLVVVPGTDYLPFPQEADVIADCIEEFVTGAPPMQMPDRALATVLFTDIVGSTAHATRLGDRRWSELLDQHDAVIARELARFRGRKVNPTGDGMLATFDGPARAVRCAAAICDAVRPLGVEVRAGLHVGEVELRGDDIGGIAVHIGQRISGVATPGEVLVSRTVTDLVAGSGIEFEDRGEHELKGVPGSWQLFAATG